MPQPDPQQDRYAPLWLLAVVLVGLAFVIPSIVRSPKPGEGAGPRAGEAEVGVPVTDWKPGAPEIIERTASRFPDQTLGAAMRDRARGQGATTLVRCVEREAPDLGERAVRIGCAYEGEDWVDVYYWAYDPDSRALTPLNALAAQITLPEAR